MHAVDSIVCDGRVRIEDWTGEADRDELSSKDAQYELVSKTNL